MERRLHSLDAFTHSCEEQECIQSTRVPGVQRRTAEKCYYCLARHIRYPLKGEPNAGMLIQTMAEREINHPFFDDPRAWLDWNRDVIARGFGPADVDTCSDEATLMRGRIFGVFTAGAGILQEDADWYAGVLREYGVKEVRTHSNCGANAFYTGKKHPGQDPTAVGKRWAMDFAHRDESASFKVSHLQGEEMPRPEDIHTALTLYYLASPRYGFNTVQAKLPIGFRLTRPLLKDPEEAMFQLDLLSGIAENHGYGEHFQEFHTVVIGDGDKGRTRDMVQEAEAVAQARNRRSARGEVFRVLSVEAPV